MGIIVNSQTRVLIQGITGKSGLQAAGELLGYKMNVTAGVTPGKGGQNVFGVPVFNTIGEAIDAKGNVDVAMVYVPPQMAKGAAIEAIKAKIPLIHIFVEKIPIFDVCQVLATARDAGVRVLGPASVGAITPGEGKIGSIGGLDPNIVFFQGP